MRRLFFALCLALQCLPAAALAPQDQGALAQARALFLRHRYAQARALVQQVQQADPANATAQYYLGRAEFALGDHKAAISRFKAAVRLRGDDAEYHFWLGRAYGARAMEVNVLEQAWLALRIKEEFRKTVELDPDNVDGRVGLGNFYLRAPGFMGGDLKQARDQAQALIALDPLKGGLLMAQIEAREGRVQAAEARYRALVQRYGSAPGADDLYEDYGRFLLEQGRPGDAIRQFQRERAVSPEAARPCASLGDGYRAAGRLADAARAYRQALAREPDDALLKKKLHQVERDLSRASESPR